jgi:prevent-host-death family protein
MVAYVLYVLYASYMPSLELTVTEARAQLADLVNRVAYSGDRIVLTRHGRPMAVLISVDAAEAVSASDNAVSDASTIEQLPPPRSLETPQLDYGIAASTTITPTTSGPGHQPGRS